MSEISIKTLEVMRDTYTQMGQSIFAYKLNALNDAIKALNEHNSLVEEVKKLKNKIEVYELAEKAYIEMGERLEKENGQLREALRKLKPEHLGWCVFCEEQTYEGEDHTDDCEYIKLCGGAE